MTTVDIAFPLRTTQGEPATVPRDHGYALFGAISRVAPALHDAAWLMIHPLSGKLTENGHIVVGSTSGARLRLPAEHMAAVLPLVGSEIELLGRSLRLGAPTIHALTPSPSLDARLVLVKLTNVPRRAGETHDVAAIAERTIAELSRQLDALDIQARPELRGRRSMEVAGKRLIGFSVRVAGLDATQSIALQTRGLGGKHRMGCGIFRPTRGLT